MIQMKTKLMSNPEKTSYKLIIKYGENIVEKIFDGANAYKRAIFFQKNIQYLFDEAKQYKNL